MSLKKDDLKFVLANLRKRREELVRHWDACQMEIEDAHKITRNHFHQEGEEKQNIEHRLQSLIIKLNDELAALCAQDAVEMDY